MSLPVSKKQATNLGHRLSSADGLSEGDAALFQAIIDHYDLRMSDARDRVERAIARSEVALRADLTVTGRTKTTLTLRQKLTRTPEVGLPYIRDIAGVRIVGDMLLDDQDKLAELITADFEPDGEVKTVDRRASPVSGYRALHVVVICKDVPVEVQIRTELQALWADLYERQADMWGRGVRYGDPPDPDADGSIEDRVAFLDQLIDLSLTAIAEFEKHRNESVAPPDQYADTEQEISQLLKIHTSAALKRATRLKVSLASLRRSDADIERILAEWAGVVKRALGELAARAELIK